MILSSGTVHLVAETGADGQLKAMRLIFIDAATGRRRQLWPEQARPVLSIPLKLEPENANYRRPTP